MRKHFIYYILAAVIFFTASFSVQASQTNKKLKETGDKIDELKEQKEAAEEKVDTLEAQENGLQGDLAELNGELSDVSAQINELEGKIADKQEEIAETAKLLEETEAEKEQQYESMKLRIRFIYENGGTDFAAVLFASASMSELLNRAEYVEEINRYDRRMLSRYEDTCRQVAEKEETLKAEKEDLLAMQTDMEEKEEQVNGLIAKTQASISDKQKEISSAQEAVDDYEAQIAKMKAYEEELEKKKAEEAKKRAAEQKKKEQQASTRGGGTVTANAGDLAMLAALVECEAGGEGYEGQWAVASVVVNRVKSGSFPNTVSGVIYQGGQFSPVASGRFAMVLARGAGGSCMQAANAALSGSTNVNSLYFCRASSGVEGTVIGNHVFY